MRLIRKKKEILFGVKIITCPRKKVRPLPELVRETLESLNKQRYTNWRAYLIGDWYDPQEEFQSYVDMLPRDKVIAYNLRGHRPERWIFKKQDHISRIGGNTASNFCLDLMESTDIRYCANLDDDDLWTPYHLETLRDEFMKWPSPAFVATTANFKYIGVLPSYKTDANGQLYIEHLACNVAHSAVAWDIKRVPLRYRRQLIDVAWDGLYGDADMWYEIERYCNEHGYSTAISPNVTVEVR